MTKLDWLHRPLIRVISLLMAISLSAVILILPQALITDGQSNHGLLMLLLLGIMIGFIHGVGFAPRSPLWRELLGPISSWPVMLYGLFHMLSQ